MSHRLLHLLRKPFEPALASAKGYDGRSLRHDMLAGLTVAVVAIPQSMAYALVAGVPVQYGLYSVMVQGLIASLFNAQRFLSVGPTNTQSLLVASILSRLVAPGDVQLYLQLIVILSLIKGLIQLAMSLARLGALSKYISQSVVVGFTAGAGILIAAGQLHGFLGFTVVRSASDWPGLVGTMQRLWPQLDQTQWRSVAMGLLCLAIVLLAKRVSKLAPGPLLGLVFGAVVVAMSQWSTQQLPLVDQLPDSAALLSMFQWPKLEALFASPLRFEALLGGAMALSLLGLMEAYAISKTIASQTGQRVSANRELFSQGLTNALSSCFQCIPGSGSFARSALNFAAGAKTCYAGVFNALFVLLIFLLLADYAHYVPLAALAAVLFVIAFGLIDFGFLKRVLRTSKADGAVCLATLAATLLIPLTYAVFVGIFLNLALYLRRASQLHMQEMVATSAGPFEERPLATSQGKKQVIFLQIEGDLFFGVADELHEQLTRLNQTGARIFIFRLKRTLGMDPTVLGVFDQFVKNVHDRQGHVLLCGVKPQLLARLQAFGLVAHVGPDNVFATGYGIFTSAKRALDRARTLLGQSIDTTGIDTREETEGWSYEI